MKTSTVLTTFAAAGAAMAAPTKRDTSSFGGIAINSGTAIQLSSISANAYGFYLNKQSSAYCPSDISGLDCSTYSNDTTFTGGDNTLYLDVDVPGGQQVYVAPAGQLLYTAPHDSITGSGNTTGFAKSGSSLTYNGGSFLACPVDNGESYQVWAYSAASSDLQSKCIDFDFHLVDNTSGKHAYEYYTQI